MKRLFPAEPPSSLVAYELEPGRVMFVHALPPAPKVRRLGKAEQEVLTLLLYGHDTRAIASKRGTSPRTVANQVASIFRKLGVSSRAALSAKVTATGIVSEPGATPGT